MSIRTITAAVVASFIAFGSGATQAQDTVGNLAQGTTNSPVKQCVWNKSGIILDIYWVHPSYLYREKLWDGKDGMRDGPLRLKDDAKEAAFDQMPYGQGRCRVFNERHYALLAISGYGDWDRFYKLIGGKFEGENPKGYIGISYPSATRYTDVWGTLLSKVQYCDDCGGPVK
uniref:Uncharacterized protein n=1 Tax=Cyanothece sp. (strain PCC 7425 / ATCC 29141) TaxID=395961 RepID=B8HXR1_CYAP4